MSNEKILFKEKYLKYKMKYISLKKDILLNGQSLDIYWTQAWDLYISTPTNAANTTSVRTKIRDLVKYLMNLAEYQLA